MAGRDLSDCDVWMDGRMVEGQQICEGGTALGSSGGGRAGSRVTVTGSLREEEVGGGKRYTRVYVLCS